jgi:diguanylate cyclase (GGDEF)-like protein
MGYMFFFSFISVGVFLWSSYEFKTFSIAYHDTYNAFIIITLSIGLHYTFQRTRISQFILYQKDLQIQKELEIKSSFDTLTGLLNRERFFSIVDQLLHTHKGYSALCLLDLDGFKQINDNLGHQMGDKVIQTVGQTIIKTFNIPDRDKKNISSWGSSNAYPIAGRLGGDEFIMMIHTKNNDTEVQLLIKNLLSVLNSVKFDGVDGIHASIGITQIIQGEKDIDNAYKRADEALYASKRAGKNQIQFSTETLPGDA